MPSRGILPLGGLAVVLALCYLVYAPGLTGPWLLDDAVNILPARLNALSWQELRTNIFATERLGGLSRSIGILSLAVTEYIYGADVSAYKYQNVMLHLATGLLVFWFVSLLHRSLNTTPRTGTYWFALVCTAIWMLHPLQVSTVLYVVQRLVILSAFFSLLTLCLYLEGRRLARSRPYAGSTLILFALVVFWPLAIISKENAVLIVLVVPLLEYFLLGFKSHSKTERRLFLLIIITFFALPLVIAGLYTLTNPALLLTGYEGRSFTLPQRLLTEAHALWFYVKLILFPIPGHMSLYHDGFPIQTRLDAATILALLGWLTWIVSAFLLRNKAPLIGFGLLWFLAWHMLESTIVPLELVFEHRNYLALLGLVLALVGAAAAAAAAQAARAAQAAQTYKLATITALATIALLSANTAARAFVWSDVELMIRADYERHAQSPRVVEGMIAIESAAGNHEKALEYVTEYQALVPDSSAPFLREVLIRCNLPEGAADAFARALDLARTGRLRPASINLTRILFQRIHGTAGCNGVSRTDLLALTEALTLNPRIHTLTTRQAALATHLRATAVAGDWVSAKAIASQLLKNSVDYSPAMFANSLESVTQAAALHDSHDDAIRFIKDVMGPYANITATREVRLPIPNTFESGTDTAIHSTR
jgi:protein O-mannosyl-transferase